jgi:hypothetical protein
VQDRPALTVTPDDAVEFVAVVPSWPRRPAPAVASFGAATVIVADGTAVDPHAEWDAWLAVQLDSVLRELPEAAIIDLRAKADEAVVLISSTGPVGGLTILQRFMAEPYSGAAGVVAATVSDRDWPTVAPVLELVVGSFGWSAP